MTEKIKILHLEEGEAEMKRVSGVLDTSPIDAEIMVVDNKGSYIDALMEFTPDVILSNHTLPDFDSKEALDIFHQSGLNIPFILVTDTMSEEYAVSMLKSGADDYILKSQLESLPGAILDSLQNIVTEIEEENQVSINLKDKTNAVLSAQEAERGKMSYELLENINQILAASNLYIDCAISDADETSACLQDSKKYILLAIEEIKNLSQVIMPPTLEDIGLVESLNNWIDFKRKRRGIRLVTNWENFNSNIASNELQLTIYRIVQERVNDIIKNSGAQSIHVTLEQKEDNILLTVKDDGPGFDTLANRNSRSLKNINTRAEIHNGKLLLNSIVGQGCILTIIFGL